MNLSTKLLSYLPQPQEELLFEGQKLIDWASQKDFSDYSFIVFPFSKCYEGFLKKLFKDLGFISEKEYYSDKIRIGRILNPHYANQKPSHSAYAKLGVFLKDTFLPEKMWQIWKKYRNQIFHYFPSNLKKLSYSQAVKAALEIIEVMQYSVDNLNLPKSD